MSNGTMIVKRDGSKEHLNIDKIHKVVMHACLDLAGVSASQIEMNANLQFYDSMTTQEIQEVLIRSANDLINLEIDNTKNINAVSILDKGKALDISQLASLIKESSFVIANDTGPAHISAHLGAKGLTLFGKHTTAYKVSIERENFKAIQVDDLEKLSAAKVLEKILI